MEEVTKWETLTNLRPHGKAQVSIGKESDLSGGHSRTGYRIDRERSGHGKNAPSEGHSLSGERVGKDRSGHGRNATSKRHSLPGDRIRRNRSGHGMNVAEGGTLTS